MRNKIKAYRLGTNISWFIFLLVLLIVMSYIYVRFTPQEDIFADVMLAVLTSILAGIITAIGCIISQYNTHKNQKFLEDIQRLGIKRLHFHKKDALITELNKHPKKIVISGYRLLLTKELTNELYAEIKKGAKVEAIITPYWSYAYQMLYPNKEYTLKNYYDLLNTIFEGVRSQKGFYNPQDDQPSDELLQYLNTEYPIIFTGKALFNDTYQFDDTFITSPYFHVTDDLDHPLHAKDFFTYEVSNPSDHLWELLHSEIEVFENDPDRYVLNWKLFYTAYQQFKSPDQQINLDDETRQFNAMLYQPEKSSNSDQESPAGTSTSAS